MNMNDFAADHEKAKVDVEAESGSVEVYIHNVEKNVLCLQTKKILMPR